MMKKPPLSREELEKILTPRILRIPYAVAAKYAPKNTNKYDELTSYLNVEMIRLANSYDPTRGTKLSTFLFRWLKVKAWDQGNREIANKSWRERVSCFGDMKIGDRKYLTCEPTVNGDLIHKENADLIERVLSKLDSVSRNIYVTHHVDGVTMEEIGSRIGLSKDSVNRRMRKIQKKISVILRTLGRSTVSYKRSMNKARSHLKSLPDHVKSRTEEKRRKAISEAVKGKLLSKNLMRGKVPAQIQTDSGRLKCRYLVDDEERKVFGPYTSARKAVATEGKREVNANLAREFLASGYKLQWLKD